MGFPTTSAPSVPQVPLVDQKGIPTPSWYAFFIALFNRTGGSIASASPLLDTIISTPGALLARGASLWQGVPIGSQSSVLTVDANEPAWEFLSGANFGPQAPNTILAGPAVGPNGVPSFRDLVTADLDSIAGQIPGIGANDNAANGNIGEYISSSVPIGSAVSFSSGTPADVTSIALTPGDWDVWASFGTAPAGTTTTASYSAWINGTSATDPAAPNGGAYFERFGSLGAGIGSFEPVGMKRISIAGATTIYLSATIVFAISTMGAYGFLGARRAR